LGQNFAQAGSSANIGTWPFPIALKLCITYYINFYSDINQISKDLLKIN
jgi:hypothetical protein